MTGKGFERPRLDDVAGLSDASYTLYLGNMMIHPQWIPCGECLGRPVITKGPTLHAVAVGVSRGLSKAIFEPVPDTRSD